MNILITGYHGFVGQNILPYLKEKGHTVYGLGRSGDYVWDDLDGDKIPHVDAIIHLAGKAHDTKNQTEADVYFKRFNHEGFFLFPESSRYKKVHLLFLSKGRCRPSGW